MAQTPRRDLYESSDISVDIEPDPCARQIVPADKSMYICMRILQKNKYAYADVEQYIMFGNVRKYISSNTLYCGMVSIFGAFHAACYI